MVTKEEYFEALEIANRATAVYHEACKKYRAREIDDDEFLAAKAVYHTAEKAFDRIYEMADFPEDEPETKDEENSPEQLSLF